MWSSFFGTTFALYLQMMRGKFFQNFGVLIIVGLVLSGAEVESEPLESPSSITNIQNSVDDFEIAFKELADFTATNILKEFPDKKGEANDSSVLKNIKKRATFVNERYVGLTRALEAKLRQILTEFSVDSPHPGDSIEKLMSEYGYFGGNRNPENPLAKGIMRHEVLEHILSSSNIPPSRTPLSWSRLKRLIQGGQKAQVAEFERAENIALRIIRLAASERLFWNRLREYGIELPDSQWSMDSKSTWLKFLTDIEGMASWNEVPEEVKGRVRERLHQRFDTILKDLLSRIESESFERNNLKEIFEILGRSPDLEIKDLRNLIERAVKTLSLKPDTEIGIYASSLLRPLYHLKASSLNWFSHAEIPASHKSDRAYIFFEGDQAGLFRRLIFTDLLKTNSELQELIVKNRLRGLPTRIKVDAIRIGLPLPKVQLDGLTNVTIEASSPIVETKHWSMHIVVKDPDRSDGSRDEERFAENILAGLRPIPCANQIEKISKHPDDPDETK